MSVTAGDSAVLDAPDSISSTAAGRRQRSDRRFVAGIRQKLKDAEAIVDLEIYAAEVGCSPRPPPPFFPLQPGHPQCQA